PALAQGAVVTDDHTHTVPAAGNPFQRFADQVLAVTKAAPGGGGAWPIGTGDYWVTSGDPEALVAQPMRSGRPALKIVTAPASASRDALDAGADLLVTDDPATLEYARTLAGYTDLPLDWSRTYVLLAPGRDKALAGDLRLETLQEAVRRDARPAEWSGNGHYWFSDLSSCGLLPVRDTLGAAGRRRRIVYNQSDRSAADVAALLLGFGAVVLVPLTVFGLRIRVVMANRLTGEYQQRVTALVSVIRADLDQRSAGIALRLAALRDAIPRDNRFRAALQGGERTYL